MMLWMYVIIHYIQHFSDREYTNEEKNDVYRTVYTRLSGIMDEMVKEKNY